MPRLSPAPFLPPLPLLDKALIVLGCLIIVLLVGLALIALRADRTPPPPAAPVMIAPPADFVRSTLFSAAAKTTATPLKTRVVQAYAPALKQTAALPAEVQADPAQVIIATAAVAASDEPHSVITTMNTDTGIATSYLRHEPAPWLSADTRTEIALLAGFKSADFSGSGLAPVTRLSIRQNLLAIKTTRLAAVATLDSDGSWFAGAGLHYRF